MVLKTMTEESLTRDIWLRLHNERKTLTQYLEEIDPSGPGDALDAFERRLKRNGLVTKSLPDKGIWADTVEKFYMTEESKVIFPEVVARTVREAITQDTVLPHLVATTTTITGDAYRSFYVDEQPQKSRLRRVTEAAELPRATIRGREQAVRIYKYGRAIEASYEVVRRMQIDMLALHIRRIAIEVAKDKVAEVLAVIKDGDGNKNGAPVLKLSELDADASGNLTPTAFLRFLMEFDPFPCDTIIASKEAFVKLMLTQFPNLTVTEVISMMSQARVNAMQVAAPQFPGEPMTLLWSDSIADDKLYGINRRFAIEEITEAGSDVREADHFITRQTNVLTISENTGYAKIFNEATKVLDLGS